jgi:predicted nucleic acid-binding protein
MIVVDTSVLIDFLGGFQTRQALWLREQTSYQHVAITSLIFAEVLQGVREDNRIDGIVNVLGRFATFETGSHELALKSALNDRFLRSRGITIRNTIDCIVATFCIEDGHQLLHNNSDFGYFEAHLGLRIFVPPNLAVQ